MSTQDSPYQKSSVDIAALRRSPAGTALEREDLAADAIEQFADWFRQACDADLLDPNAMSLATVDESGKPATRTVLLKYFDEKGLVFFTNLGSNKAQQIANNDNVALLFFWPGLDRQVSIKGTAEQISKKDTMRYFVTRPRGSQIGAWISAQSNVVSSRALLEAKFEEMKKKFANKEVPLPTFWGGYRVVPQEIEFWQGRKNRLHDRFLYTLQANQTWKIERLAP